MFAIHLRDRSNEHIFILPKSMKFLLWWLNNVVGNKVKLLTLKVSNIFPTFFQ